MNRRNIIFCMGALAGTALWGSTANAHVPTFSFKFLTAIPAGQMPLRDAIDEPLYQGKSNVSVGWTNLIARAAAKAGIPTKPEHEIEYDLFYDPSRWGDRRALLVLGADVILKPKNPVTKDVRGMKVTLYPGGLAKEGWDAWMSLFMGGFKYEDIDPYSAGEKIDVKSPFALIVNIDDIVGPHVFGWQPGTLCYVSKDLGAAGGMVGVLASNVRFVNSDGRWKALAKGARRKWMGTPGVMDPAAQPAQTPPSGPTKIR